MTLLRYRQNNMENQTPALNKALVEARKEIHNPAFDSTNPHFKSKFASLKAVIAAIVPVMAKHGIAVVQDLVTMDGGVGCYTYLLHESGEEKRFGPFVVYPTKNDPQGQASASTYARRYGLQAVGNVVGDVDDDGNAASEPSFSSKQMKTKVWNTMKDAAAENDALKCGETWRELTTDQQKEIWKELSSGQRSTIKTLLAETDEE